MPERTPMDKIQPCLLDRLTDDEPNQQAESRSKRVVSVPKYKEGILRDLSWLLNANCHRAEDGWDAFPEVKASVLNYGISNFAGVVGTTLDPEAVEKEIYEAIVLFEPRVIKRSLSVKLLGDKQTEKAEALFLRFEIQSDLWAQPLPEQFFAKTEIDLETGACVLKE